MIDKIVKQLAAKYNLSEEVIEKVIRSEFNFVANTMQQGEFQSVHLHHLGKFAVRPRAIENVTRKKEEYIKRRDVKQASNNI